MPTGLSAVPTLYQTQCETTGARWFSITTTCIPFSRVKLSGLNIPEAEAARESTLSPSVIAPAIVAKIMLLTRTASWLLRYHA